MVSVLSRSTMRLPARTPGWCGCRERPKGRSHRPGSSGWSEGGVLPPEAQPTASARKSRRAGERPVATMARSLARLILDNAPISLGWGFCSKLSRQPSERISRHRDSGYPTVRARLLRPPLLPQDLPIFRPGSARSSSLRDAVPPAAGRSSQARGSAGRPQTPSATPMFSRLSHSPAPPPLRKFGAFVWPAISSPQGALVNNNCLERDVFPPRNQTALLSLSVVPHNEKNDDRFIRICHSPNFEAKITRSYRSRCPQPMKLRRQFLRDVHRAEQSLACLVLLPWSDFSWASCALARPCL